MGRRVRGCEGENVFDWDRLAPEVEGSVEAKNEGLMIDEMGNCTVVWLVAGG